MSEAEAEQTTPGEVLAYIGMGANVGGRRRTLRWTVQRLRGVASVDAISPLYETEPVGFVNQPPFLNGVVALRTAMQPVKLLTILHRLEAEAGRMRSFRNAPRTLDLDLLVYGLLVQRDPQLTLPHPRLHERAFVLVPWHDIAPDLVVPGHGRTVADLLGQLQRVEGVQRHGSLTDPT